MLNKDFLIFRKNHISYKMATNFNILSSIPQEAHQHMTISRLYIQLLSTPLPQRHTQPLHIPLPQQQLLQHIRQLPTQLQPPPLIPQKWHMEHFTRTKISQSKRPHHTEYQNTRKFQTNTILIWYEYSKYELCLILLISIDSFLKCLVFSILRCFLASRC